jgi:hypothetical protein
MQFDQLKRREFITLLGAAAVAWPLAARAQEAGRTYRLGFLIPASRESPAQKCCGQHRGRPARVFPKRNSG